MFFSVSLIFFLSMVLGYSASSFFIFWVSLEISGLCLIPMFWHRFFCDNTFYYFMVTAFSGAFLFLSWMKSWYFLSCCVVFFKVGIWPFSFWVISVAQKLDYLSGYFFLFLVKLLPFYGLFNFFVSYFYFFLLMAFVNLVGSSMKLFNSYYYSLYEIFLWMSIGSVSYWLLIGVYSFYLFLSCYLMYSVYMFFLLNYQGGGIVNFDLWMVTLLFFLGGPPLIYLFFKMLFFYFLPNNFFFMSLLVFMFFFQSVVMMRAMMFSGVSQK